MIKMVFIILSLRKLVNLIIIIYNQITNYFYTIITIINFLQLFILFRQFTLISSQ